MENKEIKNFILQKVSAAKIASGALALLSRDQKNAVLSAMAVALEKNTEDILFHNKIDVDVAKSQGFEESLVDRLTLNEKRIESMVKGIRDVAEQNDPIGEILENRTLSDGLNIQKVRVPLGTVAMIYESRPNVTVDATALCIKSGNAVILRGGSEAINSNKILAKIISSAGEAAGMPAGAVSFIDITDRTAISELIVLDNFIDLLIPRGGEEFINYIKKHSTIPVLSHGKGLCHTYIDKEADLNMAVKIAVNAKCQRPGVCNATETLLIHRDIAEKILPELCKKYTELGTEIRGCPVTKAIVPTVVPAGEEDWNTEYLSLIISIKVVNSIDEAIAHVNRYGSAHSDSIITDNKERAEKFIKEVDSAAVFHNASTRLHDGGVFGVGAEIGIATNKLHARGAMGARELTTTKFVVRGNGHIR